MTRPTVFVLGKLPPPFIGPAIATDIILNSSLKDNFELVHVDTKINDDIQKMGVFGVGKIFKSIGIYLKFKRRLKELKPNLVLVPISQTTMGFLKDSIYILLARNSGAKVLIQLRGSNWEKWFITTSVGIKKYVRFTLRKTEGVIVLGECLKYLYRDFYKKDNVYVVPNGANYKLPPRKTINTSKVKLLYLANFLESKGFKDLLDALVVLNKKGITNWELQAAGNWYNPGYEKLCKELIRNNSLNVYIHPPQWGKDKFQLYANADVFVFPPNEPEGHPWVIVEAMVAGLPIISTNQGAICESVIHGENGFIVKTHNPISIAENLIILLENESLRVEMGKKSKNYYLKNFTEEKMVGNLKNTFDLILN